VVDAEIEAHVGADEVSEGALQHGGHAQRERDVDPQVAEQAVLLAGDDTGSERLGEPLAARSCGASRLP
jgi:hypothetical protein